MRKAIRRGYEKEGRMVEREGFEPSKAEPSDLQSDPFGRSGISPHGVSLSITKLYAAFALSTPLNAV